MMNEPRMQPKHGEDVEVITLRMQRGMKARLRDLAEREHRTVNAQLVALVDQATRDADTHTGSAA